MARSTKGFPRYWETKNMQRTSRAKLVSILLFTWLIFSATGLGASTLDENVGVQPIHGSTALERRISFRKESWKLSFVHNWRMSIDGVDSLHFEARTSGFVTVDAQPSGLLIRESTYEFSVFNENGQSVLLNGKDGPLYSVDVLLDNNGKIVSTKTYVDKDHRKNPLLKSMVRDLSKSKNVNSRIGAEYSHYLKGVGPGDSIGEITEGGASVEICTGYSDSPTISAASETNQAITGTAVLTRVAEDGCRLKIEASRSIDKRDGRPISQFVSMEGTIPSAKGQPSSLRVVHATTYFNLGAADPSRSDPGTTLRNEDRTLACSKSEKSTPAPSFPEKAQQKRKSGVVRVAIVIGGTGEAQSVFLDSTSGDGLLDSAALSAAEKWKFDASSCAGLRVVIPISFSFQ